MANFIRVCCFLAKLLTICVLTMLVLAPAGIESRFWSSSSSSSKQNDGNSVTSRLLSKFSRKSSGGSSLSAKMRTKMSDISRKLEDKFTPKGHSLAELFEREEQEKRANLLNVRPLDRRASEGEGEGEEEEEEEVMQPEVEIFTAKKKKALHRSKTVRQDLDTTSTTEAPPEVAETTTETTTEVPTTEVPTTERPTTTTTEVPTTTTTPEPQVSSIAPRDILGMTPEDDATTGAPQEQEFTSMEPEGGQLNEVDESVGTSTVRPLFAHDEYLRPLPGLIENNFRASESSAQDDDDHHKVDTTNLNPIEADFSLLDTGKFVEEFGQVDPLGELKKAEEKPLDVDVEDKVEEKVEAKKGQDDTTWMDYVADKRDDLKSEPVAETESEAQNEPKQEIPSVLNLEVQPVDGLEGNNSTEIITEVQVQEDKPEEATGEVTSTGSSKEVDKVGVPSSTEAPIEQQQLDSIEPKENNGEKNLAKEKLNKKLRKKAKRMGRQKSKRRYNK